MNFDRYYLQARIVPALLTIIPSLILFHSLLGPKLGALFSGIEVLTKGTGVSLSIALLFLWVQLSKLTGRIIFQRLIFQEELRMPTTNYLLQTNSYFTPETKRQIRIKIEICFQLHLYDYRKEQQQELNARKQICLAVSQIREHLRNNKMLLRHGIDYGFFKNLISGSLLAGIFCLAGIGLGQGIYVLEPYSDVFIVLAAIYLLPVLLSRSIMQHFGHYYGKILYEQFLITGQQS